MHTKEPWQTEPSGCIVGADGGTLVAESMRAKWEATFAAAGWNNHTPRKVRVMAEVDANARRIVACVNACAGISTDALLEHGVPVGDMVVALQAERAQKQCDELLAALERVANVADTAANILHRSNPTEARRFRADSELVHAAIAKVRGQ